MPCARLDQEEKLRTADDSSLYQSKTFTSFVMVRRSINLWFGATNFKFPPPFRIAVKHRIISPKPALSI